VLPQTIAGRGARPREVVTDTHASYRRAIHIRTGLHPARGETTKPVERSHVAVKDRVRPMRGLQSVATAQYLLELEGIERAHAIRRGHVIRTGPPVARTGAYDRARAAAATFEQLAQFLRVAR
jgi:hypothetical protein